MTRESFVFYRSFYENIKELPVKERAKTYDAIADYALNGEENTELTGIAKVIFTMAIPSINSNNKKYENGKKGGRPKDDDSPKKELDNIDNVILTEKQYDKLIEKYGDAVTHKAISLLDNWLAKGSPTAKGYIGKNHYAHFRSDNWTIKQAEEYIKEEQAKSRPNWGVPDDIQWERF